MKEACRRSNFELLRIVAMLMIVAHHLAVHGVRMFDALSAYSAGSFLNRAFCCFLHPGGEVGVALFFMITGFFQCMAKRTSVRNVAFEAAFYSFLTGFLFSAAIAMERLGFTLWGGVRVS